MRKILDEIDFNIINILINYESFASSCYKDVINKFTSSSITKLIFPKLEKRMFSVKNVNIIHRLSKLCKYGFILIDSSNKDKWLYHINKTKIIFKPLLKHKEGREILNFKNVVMIKLNGDWGIYQFC